MVNENVYNASQTSSRLLILRMSALNVWSRRVLYFTACGNVRGSRTSGKMYYNVCLRCLMLQSLYMPNSVYSEYTRRTGYRRRSGIEFWILDFFIALCWKNIDAPSMRMWRDELSRCIGLERLTYIAKGKRNDFVQLWKPCMSIMKDGNVGFT